MPQKTLFPETERIKCKPFLRWAGGKNWLVKKLDHFLPIEGFNEYHEPFLGGASIFFKLQPNKSHLSDTNSHLIETYECVKKNVSLVIKNLRSFENTEKAYYEIRDNEYRSKYERAAKFIYLNQTSFNGIYRVNLKGKYNVPYGFRTKDFVQADNLRNVSKSLQNVSFYTDDFENSIGRIKKNDLVFLDPPYTVSHNNNGFIKYNQKLFSLEDQFRLSSFIDEIKRKNAYYILTNAAHFKVLDIFEKDDKVFELSRANLIGGLKARRGKISEYLFTNVKSC